MASEMVISLILAMAPVFDLDPNLAVAVAQVESSLNPAAKGSKGEIGLYQIMPNLAKPLGYTKGQLEEPINNIYAGLKLLKDAKNHCIHKNGLDFLVCYNVGPKNAKNIKNPTNFSYVKKVKKALEKRKARGHHVFKAP